MTERAYDVFRAEHFGPPLANWGEIEARWHRIYSALEALPTETLHAFTAIADEREPTGDLMRMFPRLIAEARAEERACRNCKHWVPVVDRPGLGLCDRAGFERAGSDALMFVEDGSGSYAVLVTKSEFYCAHFERKECP